MQTNKIMRCELIHNTGKVISTTATTLDANYGLAHDTSHDYLTLINHFIEPDNGHVLESGLIHDCLIAVDTVDLVQAYNTLNKLAVGFEHLHKLYNDKAEQYGFEPLHLERWAQNYFMKS